MADKILIIDDDIDTLKLVGLMLERQGYEITVASNGAVGLNKAAAERPHLILLDVMMPDLDGYEVTRRLRSDPAMASIPIIMFTAKTMVDDKVAGFEAGVDDYLTKPTHPAELTAHVKAVLARAAQSKAAPMDRGKLIAFLGAKGGTGTSTLALNVSVALQSRGQDVILAELNPGRGSIALSLGNPEPVGLTNLLSRSLKDIHLRSVETELVGDRTGVRLLLASPHPKESDLEKSVAQMEAVINNLVSLCNVVVADLGDGMRPYVKPILKMADRIIVVTEPLYPSTVITRALVDDLEASGIGRHQIHLALVTRERTSLQQPWRQVAVELGLELAGILSPAPEQAHQAAQGGRPLIVIHPESLVSDQIHKLAEHIATNLHLVAG
jgi:DNA-binding response OmpR family regulator